MTIENEGALGPTPRAPRPTRIERELAEHLATSPEDRVYRRAIRDLFPEGRTWDRPNGGQHNNVSLRLRAALRAFEREGWIARDGEAVVVLDRAALWLYATSQPTRAAG